MTLTPPKKNTSTFEPVPAGNHVARLYEIIHLGTVPNNWQGQERMTDKIRLVFELSNERQVFKEGEEPKPYSLSREFTYSFGTKAALRSFVEGMTGSKSLDDEWPDLEAMLGDACLLNVVHDTKGEQTYANIQGASPLPKGMEAPEPFNKTRLIDINSTPWDVIVKLPEFIQKEMQSSEEWVLREKFDAANVKEFRPKIARPMQRNSKTWASSLYALVQEMRLWN